MISLRETSQTFFHYPNDVSLDEWTEIKASLFSIAMKIGLTEPLTAIEQFELCRFLKSRFKDINKEEVVEAFDLYCSGELDFKKSSFNVISNLFLGNVLQSFKRYRTQQLKKFPTNQKQLASRPGGVAIPKKQYLEEQLFSKYDLMLANKPYPFSTFDEFLLYKSLSNMGVDFGSAEDKLKLMVKVRGEMIFETRMTDDQKDDKVRSQCMKVSFRKWVKDKANFEIDIREEILAMIKE